MKILISCIRVFLTLPIWLYLIYKILVLVNATELMWFLFWVYVPLIFFVQIASDVAYKATRPQPTN